jgi:FlaA1/EpsC-like NDP-sugar epimerase
VLVVERLRRPLVWCLQLCLFASCGLVAFLLRFDFVLSGDEWRHCLYALPVWLLVKSGVFYAFKLDHGWMRYASVMDIHRLLVGNVAASSISTVLIVISAPAGFPRSIYLLDFLLCFLATSAVRVTFRILQSLLGQMCREDARNVLVYGAGAAGDMLVREIEATPDLGYKVSGFVDDNRAKHGFSIQGVRVLGGGEALTDIVRTRAIDMVLIAVPSANGKDMTKILERCHVAGVVCKTVPPLMEVIEGRGMARQIRDVAVEDLLGRTAVRLDTNPIADKLSSKVVLVTGAGGSIGSELCRQIARFRPRAIVGYDIAETALFELDLDLHKLAPGIPFYPAIGSIQDLRRLSTVFRQYGPTLVYHAAAYKHVPLMEQHLIVAVENNIFGTYNVATVAMENGAEDFVMISSDKAVRPTNIMGVTKRIAELLILSLQNGRTKYVSVRFGNVLGSNGSVIPVFKRQIAAGGPVTVTHPAMRRYFMTIPEAVQLVLQASTLGTGGEVFVLDMGEPVRIADLARNLILLSGLRPGQDIRVEFTGVRPGEKLYEELSTMDEATLPTSCEKIKIFAGNGLPVCSMAEYLDRLHDLCESQDAANLVLMFKEIVPDYSPSAELLRSILRDRPARVRNVTA